MNGGFPAIADIDILMAGQGVAIPDLGNPTYYDQFKQMIFSILNRSLFAGTLSIYMPTAATFNIVGGYYSFKNTVKTYTPGVAINPVDNDTTYIWLNEDNTIGSGIDGSGWPTDEHIKLAEIDVDEDGIITEVRDLRGQTFFNYPGQNLFWENEIIAYENELVLY